MSDELPIGLVGVGLLGSAIAERLIAGGMSVVGFDIDRAQLATFAANGGLPVDHPEDIFRHCETIVVSLPNSDIVANLVASILPALRPGQLIIDTSTGEPARMIAMGKQLAHHNVHYVEALVAGSSQQVRVGEVILFLGGEADALEPAGRLLAYVTSSQFRLGAVGSASRFKLVHNMLLGLHRAALAECLTFASSLGFDQAETLQILQQTPAASAVMQTKGKRMVERDFSPQARLSQHLKDVRLIVAEAEKHGCQTPLSELHQVLLEHAEQLGFGDADNCAIIEAFRAPARNKSDER